MRIAKDVSGPAIFYLLSFLPAVIWFFAKPSGGRFLGLADWLTALGQISGLVALAILSLSLVLISRWAWLEDYFGGLDRVYRFHHFFNSLGFILLLGHPLALAGKFLLFSTQSAALFLLPDAYWFKTFGIAALLGVTLFLVLSIFVRRLSYEARKINHKILGLAYLLILAHSFFIASDISRYFPLRLYMLALALPAVAAFIYRGVLSRWLVKKHDYEVAAVKVLPGGVTEVTLRAKKEKIRFSPGQFIFISFSQFGFTGETHPFSLASSFREDDLRIVVKGVGDYTKNLPGLKIGTPALIEGPFGRFGLAEAEPGDQIWIAGGIGVTPFLSLARSLGSEKIRVDFYYLARTEEEAVFLQELSDLAERKADFRLIPYISERQPGRLTAEIVDKLSGGVKGKKIRFCGPPPMMAALKKQFRKLGVKEKMMRSEEFQLL